LTNFAKQDTNGEIDPPVRVHPNGSHAIIYRTDDEDIILAVRHSRENRQENL